MKNYLLTIQYRGTYFYGWNLQPNKPTIVLQLTNAIKQFYKGKVEIRGSGRTDRGVHAIGQQASVILDLDITTFKIMKILNNNLPNDIRITKVTIKDLQFHARYNAKGKKYQYKLLNNSKVNVFENDCVWQVSEKLNLTAMKKASKQLVGTFDFKSFATISTKENIDTIKTITKITISKKEDTIIFNVEGKGFMRHMVRKIVGALVAIGLNQEQPNFIKVALKAKSCSAVKYKAPPSGLYLLKVYY